jgi:hypothetical protein
MDRQLATVPIPSSPTGPAGAAPPALPSDEAACTLLRAVARWPSAVEAPQLRALAAQVLDWDALIALARGHRVAPTLFECLSGLEIPVPESASRQLAAGAPGSGSRAAAGPSGSLRGRSLRAAAGPPFRPEPLPCPGYRTGGHRALQLTASRLSRSPPFSVLAAFPPAQ